MSDPNPHASHVRRNTNIETDIETTPFAHRYLFKRPRVKEHLTRSDSSSLILQNTVSSHTGFTIPGEENTSSEGIDNPNVEKRRFELFIDLIWVGIIGNIVSRSGILVVISLEVLRETRVPLLSKENSVAGAERIVLNPPDYGLATGRTFFRPSLHDRIDLYN